MSDKFLEQETSCLFLGNQGQLILMILVIFGLKLILFLINKLTKDKVKAIKVVNGFFSFVFMMNLVAFAQLDLWLGVLI